MRYDVAPVRGLIWLAAAVVGWAVVVCAVLYVPQTLAGLAVAAVLLWRKGQRPVEVASRTGSSTSPRVLPRDDVRPLVSV